MNPDQIGIALNLPERQGVHDSIVVSDTLALVAFAHQHGIRAAYAFEHHCTGYLMSPAPLSLLSYIAGAHPGMKLGTLVAVAPWHDPVRLAGEISQLDNLNNGNCIFGIGRGSSDRERRLFTEHRSGCTKQFEENIKTLQALLSSDPSLPSIRPTPRHDPAKRLAFPARNVVEAVHRAQSGVPALVAWDNRLIPDCTADVKVRAALAPIVINIPLVLNSDHEVAKEIAKRAEVVDQKMRQTHYQRSVPPLAVLAGSPEQIAPLLTDLAFNLPTSQFALELLFGDVSLNEARDTLMLLTSLLDAEGVGQEPK